jgi:hypothetical protein
MTNSPKYIIGNYYECKGTYRGISKGFHVFRLESRVNPVPILYTEIITLNF